ncbi:MAG: tetratricopeptide repeat protein [Thermodesulfobacteriota bacterium]|nr:tetratricopeptide repeat protein [Thermodesulfobacteriota bacterium]
MTRNQDNSLAALIKGYRSSAEEDGKERCLSENEMAALLEKRLPKQERAVMDEHLAACSRCRKEAAALARALASETIPLRDQKEGFSLKALLEEMLFAFRRPAVALAVLSAVALVAVFSTVQWQASKPQRLLAKAERLLEIGEVDEARTICERVLALGKLGPELGARATRNLGLAFHKSALKDIVTGFLRKTTDPFPSTFTVALLTRSKMALPEKPLLSEKVLEKTMENYHAAMKSAPGNVDSMRLLASAYDDGGKREEAKALYEKAVDMAPSDPDVLNDYGVFLLREEKTEEAIGVFLRALEMDQEHLAALYNAASIQERLGRLKDAKKSWLRYLDLDGESPWGEMAALRLGMLEEEGL